MSQALQKVKIEVNESGTVASSSTGESGSPKGPWPGTQTRGELGRLCCPGPPGLSSQSSVSGGESITLSPLDTAPLFLDPHFLPPALSTPECEVSACPQSSQ